MADDYAVLGRQALGHDGAVTGLGIALDAEQRRRAVGRKLGDEGVERRMVEDLARVSIPVLVCEHRPRSFAFAPSRVLGVLDVTQLGRRRQLLVVLVGDAGVDERGLQAAGVRPCVLPAADAAALADVEQEPDVGARQGLQKVVEIPFVHPDRDDVRHPPHDATAIAEQPRSLLSTVARRL